MRQRFPVFDLHCDTAVELSMQNQAWQENCLQLDLARSAKLEAHTQLYAFCCVYDQHGGALTRPQAETRFVTALSNFLTELERHKDTHKLCRSTEDRIAAAREGKRAVLLSLEGPEVIGCDPDRLEELRDLGFVMTTLTWNHRNLLAGSHKTGEGLSEQGIAFVRRAQELGIVIDVSHLSEQAFWDLVRITSAPIVASHSNARAVCGSSRNLSDEQIKAICNLGGLIGINLYTPFLTDGEKADFSDVRRHIDHILALGGKNHLALGGDLDGCDLLPEGFTGIDSYNDLGRYLMETGLDEGLVLNIFNNNASRFFLQHLQESRIGG